MWEKRLTLKLRIFLRRGNFSLKFFLEALDTFLVITQFVYNHKLLYLVNEQRRDVDSIKHFLGETSPSEVVFEKIV